MTSCIIRPIGPASVPRAKSPIQERGITKSSSKQGAKTSKMKDGFNKGSEGALLRNLKKEFEKKNREWRQSQAEVEDAEKDFEIARQELEAARIVRQVAIDRVMNISKQIIALEIFGDVAHSMP